MTSGTEIRVPLAPILWITGLSGVGKSTLARSIVAKLRSEGLTPLLLDGDGVREALEPAELSHEHAPDLRAMRAWRIARLARLAATQGVPVVVATISLLHEVHAWNRSGHAPYAEILLHADFDTLRRRKPEFYDASNTHVVGIDIKPEFPLLPEAVFYQSFDPSDLPLLHETVLQVWRRMPFEQATRK